MKFMAMVWPAFLARVKPVSTMAKPGLHEHDQEAGDQSVQIKLIATRLWPTTSASFSRQRLGLPQLRSSHRR